jgi:hypothetical protein
MSVQKKKESKVILVIIFFLANIRLQFKLSKYFKKNTNAQFYVVRQIIEVI